MRIEDREANPLHILRHMGIHNCNCRIQVFRLYINFYRPIQIITFCLILISYNICIIMYCLLFSLSLYFHLFHIPEPQSYMMKYFTFCYSNKCTKDHLTMSRESFLHNTGGKCGQF